MPDPSSPTILVTAYEPSGDALAAGVIAELRRRRPELAVVAMGGSRMAEAGARLIEHTTSRAAMLTDAVKEIGEHRRRTAVLRAWMREHRPALVVPTDSPAANWATCAMTRQLYPDVPVIHLAGPQLWAWAPWRVHKMRRLSDGVLCLLPFEPDWFQSRGVPARFVGHPIFDRLRDHPPVPLHWPDADPSNDAPATRLALLPGSREKEIARNLPDMLRAVAQLNDEGHAVRPLIALHDEARRAMAAGLAQVIPTHKAPAPIVVGKTPEALAAADAVLTVSGTATLQVAAQRKPMAIVYRVSGWQWRLVGRWIVKTRTFTLPNLIGRHLGLGDRVCPELVPHFGGPRPIAEALRNLLTDPEMRNRQADAFGAIAAAYADVRFADAAASALLDALDRGRSTPARLAG
ncbi:MAG: hypothetical protein AAGI54_02645 [Planctomycetota bacterium]